MTKTQSFFWNGEPCKIRVINVRLLPTPNDPHKMPWYQPLEGTVRQAIEVQSWGDPFVIDNYDGRGYMKVISGGTMNYGHRSFGNFEILNEVPQSEWITEHLPEANAETHRISDAYWSKRDPELWDRLQTLKRSIKNPS